MIEQSPQPSSSGRLGQVVAGLAFCALGGIAIVAGRNLDFGVLRRPGPGFFPLSLAVLLIVAGIALVVRARLGVLAGSSEPWPDRAGARRVAIMIGALTLMTLFFEQVGFLLCSAAFTFVMMYYVGSRRIAASALFSVVLAAVLYLVFVRWLGVSLPAGNLFT